MLITRQKSEASGLIREKLVATKLDLFFLGITIVIGGQYFSWNEGLHVGFVSYVFSTLIMTLGYLTLVFSLAEMTSTLPFSGGTYGFVRVAMGPYFGFLVGYCETMLNVMYVASSVLPFGRMITLVTSASPDIEPVYWVIFFVTALLINGRRGRLFWGVNAFIAVISIIILIIYLLVTASQANIYKYALDYKSNSSTGNKVVGTLVGLPLSSWFYVGVEMLPLAALESHEPKRDVPIAMSACMLVLFVLGLAVLFSASCQEPGPEVLSTSLLPLNYGFSKSMGIGLETATLFSLPAIYGTAFGFIYNYSRQMASMAKSGLMPNCVPYHDQNQDTMLYSFLFIGSIIAFVVMLLVDFTDVLHTEYLFLICILGGYMVYICALVSYIVFKTRYSTLNRGFASPLGIPGAVCGIVVFSLSSISVVALQGRSIATIVVVASTSYLVVLASMYYFAYARHHQKFSEEEQKALFSAYVINANVRTKIKRRQRGSTTTGISMRAGEMHAITESLSGRIRSTFDRNASSTTNGSGSRSVTVRNVHISPERKSNSIETMTTVASALESIAANNNLGIPRIVECHSTSHENEQPSGSYAMSPEKYAEQVHSEEESHSVPADMSELSYDQPNVGLLMSNTEDELDPAQSTDNERKYPGHLRPPLHRSLLTNSSPTHSDYDHLDSPSKSSRASNRSKRNSRLRSSFEKVMNSMSVISQMSKVLPILDDDEFNQIAEQTFLSNSGSYNVNNSNTRVLLSEDVQGTNSCGNDKNSVESDKRRYSNEARSPKWRNYFDEYQPSESSKDISPIGNNNDPIHIYCTDSVKTFHGSAYDPVSMKET